MKTFKRSLFVFAIASMVFASSVSASETTTTTETDTTTQTQPTKDEPVYKPMGGGTVPTGG